ncbi:MAG: hypothetical protein H7296_08520 [Bacteroidia bacterium]|nr:hypothetical protein [Bacteroidia bacterium]
MGDLVNEILARLRAVTGIDYVTVWNEQFRYLEEGKGYSFTMPCAFVEIQTEELQDVGGRYQGSDINVIIHIGQNVLNVGLLDENLTIFNLRDNVVKDFAKFKPATSSMMVKTAENQDFDHNNVYHYKIEYKTHWIDNTQVPTEYYTTPPTNATITRT